jgi:hypothetical protein
VAATDLSITNKKFVRVGSIVNSHIYDGDRFDGGLETDDVIKAGSAPVADEDVLRLVDVGDIVGDVIGPDSSTDNAIARFDGASGKSIQDSAVTIDDNGTVNIPTGQAYKVNGTQVVSDQEAAEADLAAVPDLTGADTIDQSGLETYLGDIMTKMNNLLTKLRSHGLIDT